MEIYQLKAFITVAEEQHLTRAAERLHISQPALSAHIKALEDELGLVLFIRTPKGMRLSREGERLQEKAASVLLAAEALRHQAAEVKSDFSGEIRLGINIDPVHLRIADLLAVVRRDFPKLRLHFFQKHSMEAPNYLRTGELDAAFVFDSPSGSEFEAIRLTTFGIVVVGPHPWKEKLASADREHLAAFPWVCPDPRCPFSRIIAALFEPLGRVPDKAVVVDSDTTIRKMVASGAGLSLMVAPEAEEAADRKEVVIVGDRVADLDLSLIYLKKRADDPLHRAILEGVRTAWSRQP